MTKRQILVTFSLVFLIGGMTGVYFLKLKTASKTPEEQKATGLETLPSEKLNEYTDGSGFVFRYPDNVMVEPNKNPDASTFADLQLTSAQVPGGISLKVTETKLTSPDEWVKKNSQAASTVGEMKLADISGREIKTERGLLAAALDQGVLFTIRINFENNKDFWQKTYEALLSSFVFSLPDTSGSSGEGNGSTEGIIFEGEEIIE